MFRMNKISLALALGLISATAAHAGVSSADVDKAPKLLSEQTDRLIVKYKDGSVAVQQRSGVALQAQAVASAALSTRTDKLQQLAAPLGARLSLLRQMGTGAHVYKLDRQLSVAQLRDLGAQIKAADANVDYVEPDRKMYPMLTPDDASYTSQWDLYDTTGGIRAPAAWDQATGTGVVVAVLDTGYRAHADLSGQIVAGYDMIADTFVSVDGNGRDNDPIDPGDYNAANECAAGDPASSSSWHGTHVAGTIAAKTNNALGVAGIAFNAKVQPVRVLGKCGGYTSDIADGITWASGGTVSGIPANATPAKVLNLSLGGSGSCDSTTQAAVNGARARGASVIVAAGNSNADAANFSPASCTGVVTVAATDRYGARAYYSNYGNDVALAAPGGDTRSSASNGILSTLNTGTSTPGSDSYAYYQGTSMASPHVAGVAALLYSAKPTATPDQITAALKSSARAFPGTCNQCGSGLLDANAAITAILSGTGGGTTISEVEPNNNRSAAQVIAAPGTINGGLSATTDTDYFRISLPAGKTLSASLAMGSTIDYDLYLQNSRGSQLRSSELGNGQTDNFTYTNSGTAAITLYLRVAYYGGGASSYTLTLGW
ncbi:S8 family peptidase [Roseateles amylovorans]|uniref:S8 family serine peptidase n=1 Tax=Roseateles amylovorans TaxID=2978473 RepID=A0ABY6B322_9BURK|nr:S8 family peptidase [Roseateles amylovorans]UXH79482.1 S8 family serine peptidase [Roseateles amylovorans]